MSKTLKVLMEHWIGPMPESGGSIELPFVLEEFCREMDSKIGESNALIYEAMENLEMMKETGKVIGPIDEWLVKARGFLTDSDKVSTTNPAKEGE